MVNIMYVFNEEEDDFNAYMNQSYNPVTLVLKTEHRHMIARNDSDIYVELVDVKTVMSRRGFIAHIIYVENKVPDNVIEHLRAKITRLDAVEDIHGSLIPIQAFFYCHDIEDV